MIASFEGLPSEKRWSHACIALVWNTVYTSTYRENESGDSTHGSALFVINSLVYGKRSALELHLRLKHPLRPIQRLIALDNSRSQGSASHRKKRSRLSMVMDGNVHIDGWQL